MRKQKILTGKVDVLGLGDIHVGSTIGLAPPRWTTYDGRNSIERVQTPLQKLVYDHWIASWGRRLKSKSPLVVFNLSEDIDGDHHSTYQIWSKDPREQADIAISMMLPYRQKCARWYACKGTPAHVGQSATWDEYIAKELGADVPLDGGGFSSYAMKVEVSGVLIDASHHGPNPGRRPWTLGDSARSYAKGIVMACLARGERPPDIILRGHVHKAIKERVEVAGKECWIVINPSWQLKTEYTNMVINEDDIADIGMSVIKVKDGKILDISFDIVQFKESRRAVA